MNVCVIASIPPKSRFLYEKKGIASHLFVIFFPSCVQRQRLMMFTNKITIGVVHSNSFKYFHFSISHFSFSFFFHILLLNSICTDGEFIMK